jgi:hypothetical protein
MKWRVALEDAGAVYKRTCQWVKPDGKPNADTRYHASRGTRGGPARAVERTGRGGAPPSQGPVLLGSPSVSR